MTEKTSIRPFWHAHVLVSRDRMRKYISNKKQEKTMWRCANVFLMIRDTIRKPHPGNISNDKRRNMCVCVAFIFPIKKAIYFSKILDPNYRDRIIDEVIISMERSIWIRRGVSRIEILPQFGREFHEETSWLVSKTRNRGETGVDDKRCSTGV